MDNANLKSVYAKQIVDPFETKAFKKLLKYLKQGKKNG